MAAVLCVLFVGVTQLILPGLLDKAIPYAEEKAAEYINGTLTIGSVSRPGGTVFVVRDIMIKDKKQQTVASKNDASKTFQRRQVYLDCSRYDSITGEQLSENKPLLEFGGKGLDQLNELVKQGLKKGDLVSIEFAVQGTTYKDGQGNTKNFTGIRPYSIERYVPKSQQRQQEQATMPQAAAPAPEQTQQPQQAQSLVQTSQDGTDGLPF